MTKKKSTLQTAIAACENTEVPPTKGEKEMSESFPLPEGGSRWSKLIRLMES